MIWPFPPPRRQDVLAVIVVIALAAGYLVVMNWPQRGTNFGFGPDWECTSNGHGEPICIKKASGRAAPPHPSN